MKVFPTVYWQAMKANATFVPADHLPADGAGRVYAVLVHVYFGEKIVLANIDGRGACTPSGRVEPGESIDGAAVRETFEETGAVLHDERRRLIGYYVLSSVDEGRQSDHVYCPTFIAEATHFENMPSDTESLGFFLVDPQDLADSYYFWDDLLSTEFDYAAECRERWFCRGYPIPDL
jgi:8-oxo-dGTP diphosphatase